MKSIFESKTAAFAAITALVGLYPPAQEIIAANPAVAMLAISAISFGLRLITKDKVRLFKDEEG